MFLNISAVFRENKATHHTIPTEKTDHSGWWLLVATWQEAPGMKSKD